MPQENYSQYQAFLVVLILLLLLLMSIYSRNVSWHKEGLCNVTLQFKISNIMRPSTDTKTSSIIINNTVLLSRGSRVALEILTYCWLMANLGWASYQHSSRKFLSYSVYLLFYYDIAFIEPLLRTFESRFDIELWAFFFPLYPAQRGFKFNVQNGL